MRDAVPRRVWLAWMLIDTGFEPQEVADVLSGLMQRVTVEDVLEWHSLVAGLLPGQSLGKLDIKGL